ncbi:MAG: putative phosphohydrolase [Planctomycetota bacterium]|nr:putative phosphohydrolase [Planctomycetota bacterium]
MPVELRPVSTELVLSRRRAVAALAIGGAAMVAGCSRNAGSRGHQGGWYALLSDPHIAADPSAQLRGETMADNLRAVVSDILHADDPPHGVLIDGDLAFHHGGPGDYQTLLDAVHPLRRESLPLHLTLGNHDDRANLRAAILGEGDPSRRFAEDKAVSTVSGPSLRFVLLDSQDGVNVTAGRLGDDQLVWLARDLDAHGTTPTVVLVHHNINARSESALRDTEALLNVLRPRGQAKAVVFGHTHVWNVREIDGIHMINLPAVGYRFLPKQPLGWVVLRPEPDGAELELRCIGGDRRQDRRRVSLRWRTG